MKFSIITVSYNSAKTIARTIESVLNQNYSDFEYIIVDGSSKDDTLNIIKKYQGVSDGKISFISEPDNGMYDAMNKGVKIAKGEIIGIVNSDDWLETDALSTISERVGIHGTDDVVYTGSIIYHYNDGNKQILRKTEKDLKGAIKIYDMGINHPATFVPKAVYEKHGLFDTNFKLQADADLINRLYRENVKFIFIDKVLSNQADGGASTNSAKRSLKDYRYILSKNGVTGLRQQILYGRYWFRLVLKRITPVSLLRFHRK